MSKRDIAMLILGAALLRGGQWAVNHPDEVERTLLLIEDVSLKILEVIAESLSDPEVAELLREVVAETGQQLAERME